MSDTNTTNNVHPNDNGKSKSKPRAKPKANTDGQGSIDLSARDTELLVAALKNLKSELSLQVNYDGMAKDSGLKDGNSAKAAWAGVRKKLSLNVPNADGTKSAGAPAGLSPTKPTGVTKKSSPRKKTKKTAESVKQEEVKVEEDEGQDDDKEDVKASVASADDNDEEVEGRK